MEESLRFIRFDLYFIKFLLSLLYDCFNMYYWDRGFVNFGISLNSFLLYYYFTSGANLPYRVLSLTFNSFDE